MEQEATAGMDRLFATRDSLEPDLAADESVQAPYSPVQMTEAAFQREIDRIYETASRSTKGIYDLVRMPDGRNWVIRWMLWRVIQAAYMRSPRAPSSDVEGGQSSLTTDRARASSSDVETVQSLLTTGRPRTSSSDVETVHSMLTTGSSVADHPSVKTEHLASPSSSPAPRARFATARSPPDVSDDDDRDYEEQRPRKMIKLDPEGADKSPPQHRRSAFWDHVMNR